MCHAPYTAAGIHGVYRKMFGSESELLTRSRRTDSSRAWLLHSVVPKMLAAISVAGVCYNSNTADSLAGLVSRVVGCQL